MQVELGKIVGVWGVKGWVKLHSYTRNRAEISNYEQWWLRPAKDKSNSRVSASSEQRFKVESCRPQGRTIVAKLAGIDSPEEAYDLIGHQILVEQKDLPALPAGQYYWHQLLGLSVHNTEGLEFGRIRSILETGANDVLVVSPKSNSGGAGKDSKETKEKKANKESKENKAEVLIPYIDQVVKQVDVGAGTMLVDWDASYLDD